MANTKLTGQLGESIAKKHLESKGYVILGQNYRTRYAEIDLIAKKENILVFIEVRTKTNEQFGTPEETLNRRKLRKITLNAESYVKRINWQGPYRIDAVCIVLGPDNSPLRIKHYRNII